MIKIGTLLQSDVSETGFYKVIGADNSLPHPSGNQPDWSYVLAAYDPVRPAWYGPTIKLNKDEMESLCLRNNVRFEEPSNE